MKTIKRQWTYDYTDTIQGVALFVATGQWDNGQLAYSMVNENGEIIPEHEGGFIQIRHNGKMLMIRI